MGIKTIIRVVLGILTAAAALATVGGCITTSRSPAAKSAASTDRLFNSRDVSIQGNAVLHYIDSRLYKLRQQDEASLKALRESVADDPGSSYLHAELSRHLAEADQFEQATLESDEALRLSPQDANHHLLRGKLYSVKKLSDQALQEYEKCIQMQPDVEECYTMKTRELLLQKEYPQALATIERLLKADPQSTTGWFYLGSIYSTYLKNPQKAVTAFKNALEEDPEDLKVLAALSQIYLEDKNYAEALKALLEMERLAPSDIPMKLRIGLVYYEMKDYDKAVERFTQALTLSPDNDRVAYYLGLLEAQRKNYEQALGHFKNVPKTSSLYKEAVLRTVMVYQEIGQADQAIPYVREALKSVKDQPDLYDILAALYSKANDYPHALDVLEEGLRRFPDQERLMFSKGVLLDKMGQNEKSLDLMRKILSLNPQHPLALNYLGYSYADQGIRLQEALQMLLKAQQLKPDDGYITDSLAWAYYKLGQKDKALELLKRANELAPQEPTILEHLGDVYLQIGDKDRARVYFQEAVAAAVKQEKPETRDMQDLERIRTKLGAL
jgi:Tfp pilus assembly protein PilF